ncbi:hypothetical protein DMB92_04340 [Campylobacter sp. MIT 99-7217]|uniref:SIMPL domain-containing protein n=1 Tax=Campylobacter sp. MIT 99-7217 TaxID=535091 RepID=UPI00115C01A8|nr:SIMPL domain-containing protein [Campylobacter sp. MIT 99-7217]TQR32337.1 hypothetical protein DMB92_04340 [Campylobacter sp. MIT 99-7217]
MMAFLKGLGIGILCLIAFLGGLVFTEFVFKKSPRDDRLVVNEVIESSLNITPSNFTSNVEFSASAFLSTKENLSGSEKAEITKAFNAILDRASKDKICRGGSYSVEPTFSYKDGISIPKGQRFSAYLNCTISKEQLQIYNTLLNDMDKIATQSNYITMSIPALKASFSEQDLKQSDEKLKEELIKQAQEKATYFSELTQKACTLQNLELSSNSHNIEPRVLMSSAKASGMSNDSFSNALPLVDEQTRKANASVRYLCKNP